jgi:hypothetical protein
MSSLSTSLLNQCRSDVRNSTTTSSNNSNSNNTTVANEQYEEIIQAKVACMMKEYRHIVNTQVVPRSSRTSTSTSTSYSTGNRTDHPLQDDITGSRSKVTFPVKLYILLKLSPKYGCHSIISWLAHGRSFKIHNRDLFLRIVAEK